MAIAEIALVVTLCIAGPASPGSAQAGKDSCSQEVPRTWVSADVAASSADWQECKVQELAYKPRPGETARCRYTDLPTGLSTL